MDDLIRQYIVDFKLTGKGYNQGNQGGNDQGCSKENPCPDDGNECTDNICNADGECVYVPDDTNLCHEDMGVCCGGVCCGLTQYYIDTPLLKSFFKEPISKLVLSFSSKFN